MKKSEILSYPGQMFDLDGTLANSINFPKDIKLLKNFIQLYRGKLEYKENAFEFLHYLKNNDKRLALISNMSENLWHKYQNNNLLPHGFSIFDNIKITGMGKLNKSDLILETLDDWKIKSNNAIYYGDTLKDAIACNDAKVKFCLVGNPKEKDLKEIQKISKSHIDSFAELDF